VLRGVNAGLGGTPKVVLADLMGCLKMPKRPPVYPGCADARTSTRAPTSRSAADAGVAPTAPAQGRNPLGTATRSVWPGVLPNRGRSRRRRSALVRDVGEVEPFFGPMVSVITHLGVALITHWHAYTSASTSKTLGGEIRSGSRHLPSASVPALVMRCAGVLGAGFGSGLKAPTAGSHYL
jgi:hypothetical protein